MTEFSILATEDDFPAIEKAVFNWFGEPMTLISIDDQNWRVCHPDGLEVRDLT